MTVLRNNFDTGPDGTSITVANSDDVPGNDAFDLVGGTGTGVVRQYSATFSRPTAEFTAHLTTGSTAGAPNVGWTSSMGSQSQIWFREYVYLSSYPPVYDMVVFVCDNTVVYNAIIVIRATTGVLSVSNSPQSVTSPFSTPTPLGAWFRLEGRFQFSATTGNWELRLFDEADSDTPIETKTATNWNLGANSSTEFAFGYAINSVANLPDLYLSGLELNNTDWPGPAPFRAGKGVPGILSTPMAVHGDCN